MGRIVDSVMTAGALLPLELCAVRRRLDGFYELREYQYWLRVPHYDRAAHGQRHPHTFSKILLAVLIEYFPVPVCLKPDVWAARREERGRNQNVRIPSLWLLVDLFWGISVSISRRRDVSG
jgi:hypothetical protein